MAYAVWRVYLTESERGWGQSAFGHEDFMERVQAEQWARQYNLVNNDKDYVPDWYVRAETTPKLVEVSREIHDLVAKKPFVLPTKENY